MCLCVCVSVREREREFVCVCLFFSQLCEAARREGETVRGEQVSSPCHQLSNQPLHHTTFCLGLGLPMMRWSDQKNTKFR